MQLSVFGPLQKMSSNARTITETIDQPTQPHLQLQQSIGNQTVIQMARTRQSRYVNPYLAKKGNHGFKLKERERLIKRFGRRITGDTHESEHTIGVAPMIRTSGRKRRGGGPRIRRLENKAPAYQEIKVMHRSHIGTNNKKKIDESGFNGDTYRDTQRSLFKSGDISSAVQINQLGYAFKGYGSKIKERDKKIVRNSYQVMIDNLDEFTYAQGSKDVTVEVGPEQKAEMLLARFAMEKGRFPTIEEENEVRERYGLDLIEED